MKRYDFAPLRERLQAFVDSGAFAGVSALVWQRGEVVACEATGWRDVARRLELRRDTIFRLASMSKPITSAAAMMLVEDGRLGLDQPIDRWMPEAAGLRVLRRPEAALDDVVPIERQPTLLDLMTHTAGFAWGKGLDLPITHAMDEATGTTPFITFDADRLAHRMCSLPLIRQPGSGWHYSNGTDLLGVIVARAAGQDLPGFLQARIFEPLGMADTGFVVSPEKRERLAVGYARGPDGKLIVHDEAEDGFWTRPPICPAGGGGLVSTLDDYLAFARMLLAGGAAGAVRLLSEASVRLMTTNRLAPEQLRPLSPAVDFLKGQGFGLGLSVALADAPDRRSKGSFSWPGGYGTTWFADPDRELIAMLVTQVWQEHLTEIGPSFEAAVCAAVDGRHTD